MNRNEFLRRARRYARNNQLDYYFDPQSGKGSHGKLTVGSHITFVPQGVIRTGTQFKILKDLDINPREF